MLIIVMPPKALAVTLLVIYGLDIFLLGANFRLIFAYCLYKRWQVITLKLTLVICCITYMGFGAYFMRGNFVDLDIDEKVY